MSTLQHSDSYTNNKAQKDTTASIEVALTCALLKEYTKVLEALNEYSAQVREIINSMEEEALGEK
jgi:hypothetical protein